MPASDYGSLTFFTSTFAVSVAVCPFPWLTVSLNVNVSPAEPTSGAVKDVVALFASLNFTDGPAVCVHKYVNVSPSGSGLLEPSSFTASRSFTVWSAPALATW